MLPTSKYLKAGACSATSFPTQASKHNMPGKKDNKNDAAAAAAPKEGKAEKKTGGKKK